MSSGQRDVVLFFSFQLSKLNHLACKLYKRHVTVRVNTTDNPSQGFLHSLQVLLYTHMRSPSQLHMCISSYRVYTERQPKICMFELFINSGFMNYK